MSFYEFLRALTIIIPFLTLMPLILTMNNPWYLLTFVFI